MSQRLWKSLGLCSGMCTVVAPVSPLPDVWWEWATTLIRAVWQLREMWGCRECGIRQEAKSLLPFCPFLILPVNVSPVSFQLPNTSNRKLWDTGGRQLTWKRFAGTTCKPGFVVVTFSGQSGTFWTYSSVLPGVGSCSSPHRVLLPAHGRRP